MTTTPRGVPHPVAADPNDVPSDIEALAEWVDSNPGVLVVTTAQRNALLGADRWVGRVVYNTEFHTLDCWNGVVWQAIGLRDSTVSGWASLRTLGTGAGQAAAGNHGHDLASASITGVLPLDKTHPDVVRKSDDYFTPYAEHLTCLAFPPPNNQIWVKKVGRVATLRFDGTAYMTEPAPLPGFVTMNSAFHPSESVYSIGWSFVGDEPVRLDISAAGALSLPQSRQYGRVVGTVTYITAT